LPSDRSVETESRDFVRVLMARAEAFQTKCEMTHVTTMLADRSLIIEFPCEPRADGIDVSGAFVHGAAVNLNESAFHLTVIDDRFNQELPIGQWPSTAHAPWGTLRPELSAPFRIALDRHTQTVSAFDTRSGRAVVWTRSFDGLPYWAAATPFRLVFSWMADTFDAEFVHGAVISNGRTAVLAVGPSGAGKSTSSLLQIAEGFHVPADDYVVLRDGVLFPIYTRAKLHDSSLPVVRDRLGSVSVVNPDAPGQKRIINLTELNRGVNVGPVSLSAVVQTLQGSRARVERIGKGRALASLAPYSISGLLGGNILSLARLARECEGARALSWTIERNASRDADAFANVWEMAHAS
jgi:hypothetical protein